MFHKILNELLYVVHFNHFICSINGKASFFFFYLKIYLFICLFVVYGCFACMSICLPQACLGSAEARVPQSLWFWVYRHWWASLWALGIRAGSLEEQPGLLITAFPPGLIIAILKMNYAFKYIKSIIILEKWINSHTPFPPAPAPHILPSAWPRWVTEANTEPGSGSVSNWLRGHAMWLLGLALCWADPFPCSNTMLFDRILKMDFLYFCSFL